MHPPIDTEELKQAAPGESNSPGQRYTARFLSGLDIVSTLYLVIPSLFFIAGYLKLIYAAPLCILLLASLWSSLRAARKEPEPLLLLTRSQARRTLPAILLLTLFFVACTGIGGFTLQFFDYVGTDAILRDLIQYDLPLAYQIGADDSPYYLVMYLAYWLPAAFVGKLLGWFAAYYAHYLWAAIGLFLIICWFMRIVGSVRLSLAVLLLFFGGMDILGRLFSEGGPTAATVGWFDYLTGVFWWGEGRGWLDHWSSGFALTDPNYAPKAGGVFFRFYSPISFMVDGPQHIVPPVLGFMMILHDLWRRRDAGRVLFLQALFPLCSVFTAAGSLPFVVLGLVETRCRNLLTLPNLTAIPVGLLYVAYFASTQPTGGGVLVSGWLWKFQDLPATLWMLALHYTVEFGILAILLLALWQRKHLPSIFWYLGCLGFFVCAPFYRMGTYNDFSSKIIIPAQFVFILLLAIALLKASTPVQKLARNAVILLLLIGAIGPLGIIARALDFGMLNAPPPWNSVRHLIQWEPRRLLMQGKGDKNSLFWSTLAKTPVLRPAEPIYRTVDWNFQELKDPLDYWIFFVEPEKYALSDAGLTIRTKGNQPFLRRDAMMLDALKVGQIKIDATVLVDGKPAEDAAIIAIWATEEQVKQAEDKWPFQRWHSNQAWPVRSIVNANSYWRGTIQDMAFYLRVPKGDEREYTIVLRDISFMER